MYFKVMLLFFLVSGVVYADKVYKFAPLPTKKIEQNIKEFIPY